MSHSGDVEGPVLPSVPPPPVHEVRAEDIVTEVGKKAGKDESSHGFGASLRECGFHRLTARHSFLILCAVHQGSAAERCPAYQDFRCA